ncbi:MAG: glycosyltransferase family 9 protein [Rhodospirillales bacterium]
MSETEVQKPVIASRPPFATSKAWRAFPSGMRRRWWLFRLPDLVARHWPLFRKRRGVLVVRMDGIGDMVLFRNSLDHYAEALAVEKDQITVLGCESWAAIAGEVLAGYRVKAINEHSYAKQPLYRFSVSLWARLQAPAVVVCDAFFRRALMADSLVWVTGAPRTVVSLPYVNEPTRPEFTYYLSQADEIVHTGDYPDHETVRHYRFVSTLLGRDVDARPPAISWRQEKPGFGIEAPYAVLNPGSNEPGRRWPLGGYKNIAMRLLERRLKVVFVGTASEMAEEVKDLAAEPGVVDLIGRTDMTQLMDVMNNAELVISNDSGPAHLAVGLGVASVIVVGGGHFGCFFPYPQGVTPARARFVYHRMDCYHCFWRCHLRQDRQDAFPCIAAVEEDQVWEAAAQLLDSSETKP